MIKFVSSFFNKMNRCFLILGIALVIGCEQQPKIHPEAVKPIIVTEQVVYDTDDPAIWIHPVEASKSLVIGTDKNEDGALFVFDLNGKIVQEKTIRGLKRPNNVDLLQGVVFNQDTIDIVVTGERMTHTMRVFTVPDMKAIDGGGIPLYEGEVGLEHRDLMGVALYHRQNDGKVFAFMGRKTGPLENYLWQYALSMDSIGVIQAQVVRKFGNFSGVKEIEAIAVDEELGFVYYADETVGIRKYYADPEKGNEELAFFGQDDFKEDHEGISIYKTGDRTGFIIVSDQQDNAFNIYRREGDEGDPHHHTLVKKVYTSTMESDGSEVTHLPLSKDYPKGFFVAMSDDKTFQYYSVEDILGELLH